MNRSNARITQRLATVESALRALEGLSLSTGAQNGGARRRRNRNTRRRRRNRLRAGGGVVGRPSSVPGGVISAGPSNQPRFSTGPVSGSMVLDHEELWYVVVGDPNGKPATLRFAPGVSDLAFLDKMSLPFDRYRLLSCTIDYRPSVGTTKDGYVVVGVDWDVGTSASTLAGAQTLLPRIRVPVWQNQGMVLPPGRLMSRLFLFTSGNKALNINPDYGCFSLAVASNGSGSVGEVWIKYRIHLEGPTIEHSSLNG